MHSRRLYLRIAITTKEEDELQRRESHGWLPQDSPVALQLVSAPNYMKPVLVSIAMFAVLFSGACTQSPEKLVAEANKYHDNKKYEEASILYQKVLAKDKKNADAYYRLGLNSLDQGKAGEAMAAFQKAVDLKPTNTDANVKLFEINLAYYQMAMRKDPKLAKRFLDVINQTNTRLTQQDPNSFDALRVSGLTQAVVNHDAAKAEDNFAKANHVKPYVPDLVTPYAEILFADKRPDDAVALINDTIAHNKSWAKGYELLGRYYNSLGQKDKLEAVLRQHVDADPASTSAIVEYATYKLQNNDFPGAEQLMLRMTKDPKTFPAGEMYLGNFYLQAKKLDQAQAAFEQGKKADPKNSIQYDDQLIKIQVLENHGPQAVAMAKELVDKNPTNTVATDTYAGLLLVTNKKDTSTKTIDEIKKMVDNNQSNTFLRMDLAKAYFEVNDRDKSLALLLQVIGDCQKDQQKTGKPQPALIQSQVLAARIYGERGDSSKALDLTSAVLNSHDPIDRDTLVTAKIVRDRALFATGKSTDAQDDLEALLKSMPGLTEAQLLLGDIFLQQRQFDKAAEQYQTAQKSNPADTRAFIGLQDVKLASGHAAEAVQAVQDMVSKNPADLTLRFQLAKFETAAAGVPPNRGQPAGNQLLQQAADNYKQIVAANPGSADVWLRLGGIQEYLGQNDAALASFQQAATANPRNENAFMNQALLLAAMGRQKESIDNYNKVLNINPDNPLALNNLARTSAESGANLDQAQSYAERAKKGAPNSPDVSDTLGYVYLQKNLNTQAAEIFRQNVQLQPANPAFRFHLAMALLKQGDKQGAKEQASKALQTAPAGLQNQIKTFIGQIG